MPFQRGTTSELGRSILMALLACQRLVAGKSLRLSVVGWVKTFAYVWKYASQFFLFSLKMRYLHCCRLMASTQWSIQACLLVF